ISDGEKILPRSHPDQSNLPSGRASAFSESVGNCVASSETRFGWMASAGTGGISPITKGKRRFTGIAAVPGQLQSGFQDTHIASLKVANRDIAQQAHVGGNTEQDGLSGAAQGLARGEDHATQRSLLCVACDILQLRSG